ncbi:hypothetical protein [Micromonospora echinospora]|uniref:hypothetical protein n=1 Tax=Micromonospora echinospora TaxID=1877 RepID=UPI003A87F0DB
MGRLSLNGTRCQKGRYSTLHNTVVNLTSHPVHVYPVATPDRIESGSITPLCVIALSDRHQSARLGYRVIEDENIDLGIPMHRVAFGTGITPLPPPVPGTFYLVPLVVGLAAQHWDDLLVSHDTVRDLTGSIIGVRRLARPQHG